MNNKAKFLIAIRNKFNDKLEGFLKSYGLLDSTTVCIYATKSFNEAAKYDELFVNSFVSKIDSNYKVLFGHLQDSLLEYHNVSVTPIDETDNEPDFYSREYFDAKHHISRGRWQDIFCELDKEVCGWSRSPRENDTFYYKSEAEDTIWDKDGNYQPNFIYKPAGFKMCWYKYPLRSCYANRDIDFDSFKKMVDACLVSLKNQPLRECSIMY